MRFPVLISLASGSVVLRWVVLDSFSPREAPTSPSPLSLVAIVITTSKAPSTRGCLHVLAFGMPGTGKTQAMCAIGHRLVESSRSGPFISACRLVQDMLAVTRDLELPKMPR